MMSRVVQEVVSGEGDGFDRALAVALGGAHGEEVDEGRCQDDPLYWIKVRKPMIEDKQRGLRVYEPWPYQPYIIGRVKERSGFLVPKSRQTGVTTTIAAGGLTHQLLYGQPFHCHIVANKLDVAMGRVLRIVKRALETAQLPRWQREQLSLGGEHSPRITYRGPFCENYIMAHAASPDVGRSWDGNCVLMEEVANMPYVEDIFTGMQHMIDDAGNGAMWAVSTYSGDGDLFCDLIDHADDFGLEVIPVDWRAHPGRDQAWHDRELAKAMAIGREDDFRQEHELSRLTSGEARYDFREIERLAKETPWIGGAPIEGHTYSKGVDVASGGGDRTVHCVMDVTVKPAQVVYMRRWLVQSSQEAIKAVEALDRRWPGMLHIDGTTERSLAALVNVKRKVAVHITSQTATTTSRKLDPDDRMQWYRVPREMLDSWGAANLSTGRVVVHPEQFPELFVALKTARKGVNKRCGKNVDDLDAFLLSNLPLARKKDPGQGEARFERIIAGRKDMNRRW